MDRKVAEEQWCTCLYNVNKVAENSTVLRSLYASNGSFSLFALYKSEGYPSSTQKTLSLAFTLRCSLLNGQKDGLEGAKKTCLGQRSERRVLKSLSRSQTWSICFFVLFF